MFQRMYVLLPSAVSQASQTKVGIGLNTPRLKESLITTTQRRISLNGTCLKNTDVCHFVTFQSLITVSMDHGCAKSRVRRRSNRDAQRDTQRQARRRPHRNVPQRVTCGCMDQSKSISDVDRE